MCWASSRCWTYPERNEEITLTEVVSVKFKGRGKAYYFAPGELRLHTGDAVVVETAKGLELGRCHKGNHMVLDERVVPPLRPVVRAATADDLRIEGLCRAREKEAFRIGQEKIAAHGLDMKLVDVECNFEGNKIIFFFTSDGRVDFRELVKDLAGVFRSRIELRQIGVRDEAKMLGGLGICGQPFCCSRFLDEFHPVSTKMAKTQSMSLNPAKISGACGRLMCCLRYEQAAYEDLVKTAPKNNAFVETPDGYGNVTQLNLLRQQVKVRLDSAGDDTVIKTYATDEVAAVPGGRPKPGEPLPHVLQLKPKAKPEPAEPEEDPWLRPILFASMEDEAPEGKKPAAGAEEGAHRSRRRRRKGAGEKAPDKTAEAHRCEKAQGSRNGEKSAGSRQGKGGQKPRGEASRQGEKPAEPRQQPQQGEGQKKKKPSRPRSKPQGEKNAEAASAKAAPAGEGGEKKPRRRWRPRGKKPGNPNPEA